MTILVDTVEDVQVDLNQGIETTPTPAKDEPIVSTKELDDFTIPEKFKGKSAEDIAKSYVELERHQGTLNNQLGDYRSMTDRFLSLEEKRVADLEKATPEEITIDPTELLANPGKVLDEYYEKRRGSDPTYNDLQSRLDRIEGQVGQSQLAGKHADASAVAGSPEFAAWVQETPFRGRIAQEALANQDVEALDYLLTEFKGGNPSANAETTNTGETQQQSEVRKARNVATESSSSGNASAKSDKRFSRRKLVDLRMRNPDEYAARSDEILLAYAQGRVDD